MKIKQEFESDTVGYDRIVITPTHFNNKPFKGFITDEEAKIIRMAIGLNILDNLHGTTFYRSEEDVLFITYKLKKKHVNSTNLRNHSSIFLVRQKKQGWQQR